MEIRHVHYVWKFGLGNAGQRLGNANLRKDNLGMPPGMPGTPSTPGMPEPDSCENFRGNGVPQFTEPLQREIGTPSVNAVGGKSYE